MSDNRFRRSANRFALFAALLLISLPIFPLIGFASAWYYEFLPRIVTNYAFFWPQLVLVPKGFFVSDPGGNQSYLVTEAIYVALLFWVVVGTGFSWVTRDWRVSYTGLSVYPVMALVMLVVFSLLGVFGVQPFVDGL